MKTIAGIYFIFISGSDRFYIGESYDIFHRIFKQHLPQLRVGKHKNRKIQNAYNKYGGDHAFNFVIYRENIENKKLRKRYEQFLIFELDAIKHGFNIKMGNIPANCFTKEYFFEHLETREQYHGKNIQRFARQMNCDPSSLAELLDGTAKICYPWYCPDKYSPNFYKLTSPLGEAVEFFRITTFSSKNNLSNDMVESVLKGNSISHKGWRLPNNTKIGKTTPKSYCFINPDGQTYRGENIRKFILENNLPDSQIRNLVAGNQKSCHGWILG